MMNASWTDCRRREARHRGVNNAAVVKSQPWSTFKIHPADLDDDSKLDRLHKVSMALQWLSLSQQASLPHLKNSPLLWGLHCAHGVHGNCCGDLLTVHIFLCTFGGLHGAHYVHSKLLDCYDSLLYWTLQMTPHCVYIYMYYNYDCTIISLDYNAF